MALRILANENVSRETVEALRGESHGAFLTGGEGPHSHDAAAAGEEGIAMKLLRQAAAGSCCEIGSPSRQVGMGSQ